MKLYNNFSDTTDPFLKGSIDKLYQDANAHSGKFRTKEITDKATNLPVYVIQVRSGGQWVTVVAISSAGHLYLKATATTYDDFDTPGWNPTGD